MNELMILIPGYGASPEKDSYSELVEVFRDEGYEVETVDLKWSPDLMRNVESSKSKINDILEKYRGYRISIFGHSWGAICALYAGRELQADRLFLASMSPEFREEYERFPEYQKKLGSAINWLLAKISLLDIPISDFKRPSLEEAAEGNFGDIFFLYGEKEYYGAYGLSQLGFGLIVSDYRESLFPQAEEVIIEGAGHRINKNYRKKVRDLIKKN